MIELEKDNLKELVESNQKVIVQYGASWCGMCRLVKPKFVELAKKNEDIVFVYADAEKYPQTRELVDISNLPTFAGFVSGNLIASKMGTKESTIEEIIDALTSH